MASVHCHCPLRPKLNRFCPLTALARGEGTTATAASLLGCSQVPREYRNLADAFSKYECNFLPPPPITNWAVEFMLGAKLPKAKMYSRTPKEMDELRKYIDTNLVRRFIQPTKSKVVVPMLFKKKKDGGGE